MAARPSSIVSQLLSQVQHVVLPPVLPGKREADLVEIETSPSDRLSEAVKRIRDSVDPGEPYRFWDNVRFLLQISQSVCPNGAVSRHRLAEDFASLKSGTTIILHIEQQNAGFLVRRLNKYVPSLDSRRHADDINVAMMETT